jgi:hypothetical protein
MNELRYGYAIEGERSELRRIRNIYRFRKLKCSSGVM